MTTKTIPAYLEDERQKRKGDLLRTEAEAARIQPLRHGHHRTAKQPELELPSPIEATTQEEENCHSNSEKTAGHAKDGN